MESQEKPTLIIINIGSPQKCSWIAIAKFLREFLMDSFVIDIPYFFRFLLVYFIIIPFRTSKTFKKYKAIWNKNQEVSPLIAETNLLAKNLEKELQIDVHCTMRYQKPSVKDIGKLLKKNKKRNIYVFFMFPHYAMSSFQTAQQHIQKTFQKVHKDANIKFLPPYAHKKFYIQSLVSLIKPYINQGTNYILFSYHGIPEKHLYKIHEKCLIDNNCCNHFDIEKPQHQYCYRAQVIATTTLVAQELGLKKEKDYSICFQSRLGRTKWIEPYTEEILKNLPLKGIKNICVVSPSFLVDCLETLEEIQLEFKSIFFAANGEKFTYIPCLNNHPNWIKNLSNYLHNAIQQR